ncbi:hypothetical protein BLA29_011976 [Euroglyphus maynei]|uniref:Uncharacterized protein n=1 Tax=Euroglyphus maynei TaxID=6958 RepID=A0A1Y3BKI2_EURMA|nr:hypothetical protein BLA29_011976 [Euroglyphus maynei]
MVTVNGHDRNRVDGNVYPFHPECECRKRHVPVVFFPSAHCDGHVFGYDGDEYEPVLDVYVDQ